MKRAVIAWASLCVMVVAVVWLCGVPTVAQQVRPVKEDPNGPPGQMSQAKILVINRGPKEAIPVSIEGTDAVRVQVAGTAAVQIAGTPNVQARHSRQNWEYRQLVLPAGQDPTASLNAAGLDGWEATGILSATQDATRIVMKRPTDR